MAELTAQEIAEKQIKRSKAAVSDFRKGVQNTKKNPMQLAKAKKNKMRDNLIKAIDDGDWEAGLDSVSETEWKELTAGKGADNYSRGIEAAEQNIIDFQTQVKPHRDSVKAQVANMPNDSYDQRIERMVANANGMHNFKYRRRRRS